ncbi:GPI ethanolamine phosphate transferase 1-like [Dreissena polymorpha]|uniref:GPI ethanolamine phosphate transferase 1-like n=1 Tax=Dreissena polymorpha TaxID=45954 RepID=UPI0022648425|nr:GPI ethanolamine phosphate transferase 1-like [Dreissena polymorpha]XP_052267723.1 GPI ethanolamine phosphate transferase 1-like [Dreissena polymorpha]
MAAAWVYISAGLLIHGLLMISIFDIYFVVPVLPVKESRSSPLPPPAKRVVFIVADGLRADKMLMLLPDGSTPAPFIRSICEETGSWGLSFAGIPSATRPGHVAMTAGFFEDPTSVGKDIGGGSIDFDTVFAETKYTWTWDTPKFLDHVALDHPDRIFSKQFPGERKYLAGINPKDMDSWVLDEVSKFLKRAETDDTLQGKIRQDRVLFFLHLGGIDHAGYIVRPQSPEYLRHVTFIDNGIKKTVKLFEDFFNNDGQTAYIFTSDHGMTDWGAHGDGSLDEVQCPLVVWGAGIQKAKPETRLNSFKDKISQDWGLDKWARKDIDQRSMAPLMAALLGVPYPKNAVMPVPDEYLDVSEEQRAHIRYANLLQLLDNFRLTEENVFHGVLAFDFRKYRKLSKDITDSIKTDIEALIFRKDFQQAISMTREKIELVVEGLRHYQHYNTNTLWYSVSASMVGWVVLLVLVLLQSQIHWEESSTRSPLVQNTKHIIRQCAAALVAFQLIFLYSQSTRITHCLQYILPVPIWTEAILKWYEIGDIRPVLRQQAELAGVAALSFITVILTTYGLHYRSVLACCMFGFAAWTLKGNTARLHKGLWMQWVGSIALMSLLVARPVGIRDLNYELVLFSGLLAIAVAMVLRVKVPDMTVKARRLKNIASKFTIIQISIMCLSTVVLYYTAHLTSQDIRTPLLNQVTSWAIFIVSLVEPLIVNTDVQSRLVTISLAFISPYILLSIGWETIYYIILVWNAWLLIEVERNLTKSQPIFLPRSGPDSKPNRVPGKAISTGGKGAVNGHSSVKQHKHTRSNDILIMEPTVTEWMSLDFSPAASESEMQCKRKVTSGDIRRALFFFTFSIANVMGTGNICSVASFDVQDVFCFITISDPPKMGPLMVFKLMMPGLVMGCFLRVVNMVTFTSIKNCSILIMMNLCVFSIVNFVWVTDVGNWTTIGESVSHHVIGQCICMFCCLQFGIVHLITSVKV